MVGNAQPLARHMARNTDVAISSTNNLILQTLYILKTSTHDFLIHELHT